MPQAILLQDVEKLGERGDVVDVSKGYLRNFLIPRKLAEPATKGVDRGGQRRRQAAAERAAPRAAQRAQENAELLNKTVLTIAAPGGRGRPPVRLRHAQDIADAIKEARGLTSTAATSSSTSRSSRSARAWSTSRSPRASTATSRPWSSSTSNASEPRLRPALRNNVRLATILRASRRGSTGLRDRPPT